MIGAVILAHEHLGRTAALARHLAAEGMAVAVHVDAQTPPAQWKWLAGKLAGHDRIVLLPRRRTPWGGFGLVEASREGARALLAGWPGVSHVVNLSGDCLPIRPVAELSAMLAATPCCDYCEAQPAVDGGWIKDGLTVERFSLYHPFDFRRQRRLFDRSVAIQRHLGIRRRIPAGLEIRVGTQWWCLSRPTLERMLADPDLPRIDRFFRRSWIPDESYFPTLAARHATEPLGPPLMFAEFDHQGKPYHFYDDHLPQLLGMEAFFVRKVWHGAETLYRTFLSPTPPARPESDPDAVRRRLRRARNIRILGREGLIATGRHPAKRRDRSLATARAYTVFDGLRPLFPGLDAALNRDPRMSAHGTLFGPGAAEFRYGGDTFVGNIPGDPAIRDLHPAHFLVNLVWADRTRSQSFHHDFAGPHPIRAFILKDPNAQIIRLREAWLTRLHATGETGADAVTQALAAEDRLAAELAARGPGADFLEIGLADLIGDPIATARKIAAVLPPYGNPGDILATPDLTGLLQFAKTICRHREAAARLADAGWKCPGAD